MQALLQAAYDNGWIELGTYEGLYCVSCEAYYTEADLIDGSCPIHGTPGRAARGGELLLQAVARSPSRLLDWYADHPECGARPRPSATRRSG